MQATHKYVGETSQELLSVPMLVELKIYAGLEVTWSISNPLTNKQAPQLYTGVLASLFPWSRQVVLNLFNLRIHVSLVIKPWPKLK